MSSSSAESSERTVRKGLKRYASIQGFECEEPNKQGYQGVVPYTGTYDQHWTPYCPPSYSTTFVGAHLCANPYTGYPYPVKATPSARSLPEALAAMHGHSVVNAQPAPEFATDLYVPGMISRLENQRRKAQKGESPKWKLLVWLLFLLAIVVSVIVVIMLAFSKMRSVSSASFRSVRQYNGRFLVTEGPLLKFDGQLLQPTTEQFSTHATKIQRELNRIFQHSAIGKNYAGSQVTQFRFVPVIPALDVSFNIRMRYDFGGDVLDLLTTLRKHVRAQGFDGNTIDARSISLENKSIT